MLYGICSQNNAVVYMKRLFDFFASFVGLLIISPLLLVIMLLVWLQDFHSPFYIAPRMGKGERPFSMVKMRSMVKNADKSGVDSTSADDMRITPIGYFIRRFKIDELVQLWNVLKGDMSLVGPRPNVQRETDLYTEDEKHLLDVRPGITDFASIVFSDEGEILADYADPDLAYNQLIRPWKSRLGLIYIEHNNPVLDLKLIFYTLIAIANRRKALGLAHMELKKSGAPQDVIDISERKTTLLPHPPPGSDRIVTAR